MPIPYHGPTDPRFAPDLGVTFAEEQVLPLATTQFAYHQPHITYVVQPGDTISEVARKLYGSNTPHTRGLLRNLGFEIGSILHVPTDYNTWNGMCDNGQSSNGAGSAE